MRKHSYGACLACTCPAPCEPGMATHTCNTSSWETAGRLGQVQGQPGLQLVQASQIYIKRPCLKTKTTSATDGRVPSENTHHWALLLSSGAVFPTKASTKQDSRQRRHRSMQNKLSFAEPMKTRPHPLSLPKHHHRLGTNYFSS